MKKILLGICAILLTLLACFFVLMHKSAIVAHPEGIIAREEWRHILLHFVLMLVVVLPIMILFWVVAWKYRATNRKAEYTPENTSNAWTQALLWMIPSSVIVAMIFSTWTATHQLDPYVPLKSDHKPLNIQVVALNWKWLFIYPEEEIATVNFVEFPAGIPIHFSMTADGSPMNSFWIPQLSGQIYAMTGMVTPLNIMADGPGIYSGKAAEINGEGYAGMTFTAKATTQEEFANWVKHVKESPQHLTLAKYNELLKPTTNHPAAYYSHVQQELFNKIVMKYMP